MSNVDETFFTTVGCMDGRVQEPILKFGKIKFRAKFADTITEAGIVGKLAKDSKDQSLIESIKAKMIISLEKHGSRGIVVHGHQECAGNPVSGERHKEDVRKSVQKVRSLIHSSIPVVGVFVKRSSQDSSKWEIEEV